ncbi:mCG1047095, partial [Mus musculus]
KAWNLEVPQKKKMCFLEKRCTQEIKLETRGFIRGIGDTSLEAKPELIHLGCREGPATLLGNKGHLHNAFSVNPCGKD